MKANIYIDGFNLYYRALRGQPYDLKWLDLSKLSAALIPGHEINRIRYFTAKVSSTAADPTQNSRQQSYLRALETIPNLSITYGIFKNREKRGSLAKPIAGSPHVVRFKVWEEKGSDVNLASHLLVDGFQDDYDFAVVISNDTDLVEPIRLVQSTLGLDVWVVNPSPPPAKKGQRDNNRMHQDLRNVASVSRRIYVSTLRKSQFPNPLIDANGRTITKPASW